MVGGLNIFDCCSARGCYEKRQSDTTDLTCKKILHVIYQILRFLDGLFFRLFNGFLWECQNRKHWKGESLYFTSLTPRTLSNVDPIYCPLAEKCRITKIEPLLKKGTCHGQCFCLLKLIQKNPNTELEELLPLLKEKKETIALYQILEACRPTFEKNKDTESLNISHKKMPPPVSTKTFQIETQSNLDDPFSSSKLMLVRCYRTPPDSFIDKVLDYFWSSRAHTFLIYINKENDFFYFFNSQSCSLYRYDDFPSLISAFTSHVKTHFSFFKQGTSWQLEEYSPQELILDGEV